ncbi:TonB-dependent receptor [Flavisphingomonas formosensis]|uniref:TonB-dependent receptor n=1 Tax=Flavisphingomonas formosensis TaxID=861534 RepID=UPI0012FC24F6|nr:TonB-dependent receptor [Sphingomonas formosensis]
MATVAVMATGAYAAEADAAAPSAAGAEAAVPPEATTGDIVVTARRTEEKLKDVPVSITAFSGDALIEKRVTGEADLQQAVPGLTMRQTNSELNINYSLRGQGVDAFSSSPSAVASYFNEFNTFGFRPVAYFDMASLQVLKGPQGTLFGRNSTGGAVLYNSQTPTLGELTGYARAGYGNYDAAEMEGAVNIPVGESLAFRFAGQYKRHDGYQRNLYDDSRAGSLTTRAVRGSMLFDSGTVRNTFTAQYTSWRGIGKSLSPFYQDSPLGPGHGAYGFASLAYPSVGYSTALNPTGAIGYVSPLTNVRQLQAKYGFDGYDSYLAWAKQNLGFYDVMSSNPDILKGREVLLTNSFSYELGDSITLKNITGFQDTRTSASGDNLSSPFMGQFLGNVRLVNGVPQFNYTEPYYIDKGFSNELQLQGSSSNDRLKFVAGLYYSWHSAGQRTPYNVFPDSYIFYPDFANPGHVDYGIVSNANGISLFEIVYKSYAAFAQASYKITPELTVTGGFRWTKDRVNLQRHGDCGVPAGQGVCDDASNTIPNAYPLAAAFGLPSAKGMPDVRTNTSLPSWTIGLDYKVSPEMMVYLVNRGSYRAGSMNGAGISFTAARGYYTDPFKPEKTYDFEAGVKYGGSLGGMRTSFNIAVYHQIINNVQRAVYFDDGGGQTALTGNVKQEKVTGVEFDGSISPAEWLELGGQGAYTHARYTKPTATIGSKSFLFGRPADVPTWAGSVYVKLKGDLPNDLGHLTYTADVYGQSGQYFSNLNNPDAPASQYFPFSKLPGYSTLNMRLAWNAIAGSNVSAAFWVKNLTEKHYYVGAMPMYLLLGVNGAMIGDPRTFGGEVSVKF